MRILHINTSESAGGAAVAASRLTVALNRHGVQARLLVRDKTSERVTTCSVSSSLLHNVQLRGAFLWERLRVWVANGLSREGLWAVDLGVGGADITSLPEFREADIIHLHWVNQGFLSLAELHRILNSGKPVVWTLHDMWPCTGICHHAGECNRYESHCHDCPLLRHPSAHDLSWQVFRRKQQVYAASRMTFVAVSQWMARRAEASTLVGSTNTRLTGPDAGHTVEVIPNTLSLEQFRGVDRHTARRSLGVPGEAKVIAFGAARIDQPGKGFGRLLEVLKLLNATTPVHLLLFGALKDQTLLEKIPCPYTFVGTVKDSDALSQVYSAADVLVNASDYETFGQTLVEAMACGCPPVSFDRGGQTDIIHHLEDGYLARYNDIADLLMGIRWALGTPPSPTLLRRSVATRFSEEVVATRHIQLYERLLTH